MAQAVRKWNNIWGSPCSIFQKMGPNIAIFDLLKSQTAHTPDLHQSWTSTTGQAVTRPRTRSQLNANAIFRGVYFAGYYPVHSVFFTMAVLSELSVGLVGGGRAVGYRTSGCLRSISTLWHKLCARALNSSGSPGSACTFLVWVWWWSLGSCPDHVSWRRRGFRRDLLPTSFAPICSWLGF